MPPPIRLARAAVLLALAALGTGTPLSRAETQDPHLLTDPMLQLPIEDGTHVVWFTEFEARTTACAWTRTSRPSSP